jgi:hypothetical protein
MVTTVMNGLGEVLERAFDVDANLSQRTPSGSSTGT